MNAFQVQTKKRPEVDPAKLAAFASGADGEGEKPPLDDRRRAFVFNLRLTEREMAALSVIPTTTPESKHAFCIRLLREKLGMV